MNSRCFKLIGALDDYFEGLHIPISRDQWHQLLKAMGFGMFSVFEVPVRHEPQFPPYKAAIGELREAERAFRDGKWKIVIINCRLACETALAKQRDEEGSHDADLKQGLEELLNHMFDDIQDPRREIISTHFRVVSKLRNMAAHGKQPEFPVRREDAELALTTTIALFRYIGQRLEELQ